MRVGDDVVLLNIIIVENKNKRSDPIAFVLRYRNKLCVLSYSSAFDGRLTFLNLCRAQSGSHTTTVTSAPVSRARTAAVPSGTHVELSSAFNPETASAALPLSTSTCPFKRACVR